MRPAIEPVVSSTKATSTTGLAVVAVVVVVVTVVVVVVVAASDGPVANAAYKARPANPYRVFDIAFPFRLG
jgi:hypothetical protein